MNNIKMNDIEELVILATNNFTKIISTVEIKNKLRKGKIITIF